MNKPYAGIAVSAILATLNVIINQPNQQFAILCAVLFCGYVANESIK